jgi:hypothetical protein
VLNSGVFYLLELARLEVLDRGNTKLDPLRKAIRIGGSAHGCEFVGVNVP